ncbi:targeting protein for Xklp2 [Diachasma alloeum]|uniref:targeting protein for Xklp2 n=1 Tax=Diachasma alloeum TaxID=454923 RepID=UPI0007384B0A|nr:targeting protein for Xklp2 [Diachasma alloeum]
MTSKIQTSTPISFPKSGNNSERNSWLNQDVTQQLYRNTWNKFKSPEKASSPWDAIEGPKFVDFEDAPGEPRDSYFDRRQSDCPSPQRKEQMVLPTSDETMEIVSSFKSCSISAIVETNSEVEDATLIADETLNENDHFQSLEAMQESFDVDKSKSDRRMSIVKPFSFELREKENQQRRESRRAYYKMLTERMSFHSFKARPAPKIHQRSTTVVNTTETEVKLETTPRRIIRVPRKTDVNANKADEKIEKPKTTVRAPKLEKPSGNLSLQKAKGATALVQPQQAAATGCNPFTVQSRAKSVTTLAQPRQTPATASNPFVVQPKAKSATSHSSPHKVKPASNPLPSHLKTKSTLQPQHAGKTSSNPFSLQTKAKNATNPFQWQKSKDTPSNVHVIRIKKPTGHSGDVQDGGNSALHSVQSKKQKPFQVSLPHRKIEIPKGPELMTAKRARERQQFEEKMRERERQKEEIKKMEAAAQQAREQEEYARLRKQTVFKARPVPNFKNVLPPVQKRPLTEPMMPIFVKRRRCR